MTDIAHYHTLGRLDVWTWPVLNKACFKFASEIAGVVLLSPRTINISKTCPKCKMKMQVSQDREQTWGASESRISLY